MTRMANRLRRGGQDESTTGGWITTYADMVTLLLAFFVILFSISTIDAARFEAALTSLQDALGVLSGGRTVAARPLQDLGELVHDRQLVQLENLQLLEVRSRLQDRLEAAGHEGHVEYVMDDRGLILRMADTALFPSSHAYLTPEARSILDTVGVSIRDLPNHVRVEGHTDSRPISTPEFPSNWELSTARSTNVIRYLIEVHGLDAAQLSAAGYGEYRPIDTNETFAGMQANRRVDIILLRISLGRSEPGR